ncbi:MAG: 3-dehydroquinate synthase [Alistipes sp.]|nr:3-dehydroquinate synthase [Alistipes sp.]
MKQTIEIESHSRIVIGDAVQVLPALLPDKRIIVITDSNVDRLHHSLFAKYDHIIIGLGEQSKNLATVERLYAALMEKSVERNCFLLGIGGGIVTDITGFVASTYMRGVEFGFISTTLLGEVDASVGGKNGVNVGGYKNMVGTITQPRFVVCDPHLLTTLSDREFRAGLAEVVKSAIIADPTLFSLLEESSFEALRRDEELLGRIIAATLRVKTSIVEADEREGGLRRVLNLGHTPAHAIEKCCRSHNHGEAVAIGLCMVAEAAAKAGIMASEEAARVRALLLRLGFDIELPAPLPDLLKAMRKDKKRNGGAIHLIIPEAIGKVRDMELPYEDMDSFFTSNEHQH